MTISRSKHVPSVNTVRRDAILAHFGSVAAINAHLKRELCRHTWDTLTEGEERRLYDDAQEAQHANR